MNCWVVVVQEQLQYPLATQLGFIRLGKSIISNKITVRFLSIYHDSEGTSRQCHANYVNDMQRPAQKMHHGGGWGNIQCTDGAKLKNCLY